MEAATPARNAEQGTGSTTIADLLGRAAEMYADRAAVRHKRDGEWTDVSYRELGEVSSEIARGLIDLGLEPGDRVALLAQTRPEWTYADFAITSAGAVVVPIYPTNSPEECEWVAGNSESRFLIAEDAEQVEKIIAVRSNLPDLEQIVILEGTHADALGLDELRERGRSRDHAEVEARAAAVKPEDPYTFIYTSGTTGPPKGCVLSHGNYREILNMVETIDLLEGEKDVVYLYLPLAHSFALLIQLVSLDLGVTIAYFGGDTKAIIGELGEVKPTYLPSVPRIFEKIYTMANGYIASQGPEAVERAKKAVELGIKVRDLQNAGQEVPEQLLEPFKAADEQMFQNVRNLFGGQLRQATTGAAPISKEILEFFYAAGVPVMEGFGMTETATAATVSTIADHKFGTVGKPFPGVEVRIAEDGELLIKGPNVFQGYYKMEDKSFGAIEDGWLHTGDLGHVDEDGFVSIVGRKKDIIITAGGKNLTPANLENDLKQNRYISQAVMYGDRRPYPVALITLDPEEIAPWATEQGIEDTSPEALCSNDQVRELIQGVMDEVNERYAQVERIKRFDILDHDLSQETGELTPTLKVKRNVVYDKYADLFDQLYK